MLPSSFARCKCLLGTRLDCAITFFSARSQPQNKIHSSRSTSSECAAEFRNSLLGVLRLGIGMRSRPHAVRAQLLCSCRCRNLVHSAPQRANTANPWQQDTEVRPTKGKPHTAKKWCTVLKSAVSKKCDGNNQPGMNHLRTFSRQNGETIETTQRK